jgi:serine/threonine-protein kinase
MPSEQNFIQIALHRGFLTPEQVALVLEEARTPSAEATLTGARALSESEAPTKMPDEARDAAELPSKRFGKFILVRELGKGGFGVVWKAWQTDLARWVALKFLHSEEKEDIDRFLREAQTAATLSHPNIVPIHEIGEYGGRHYIAMEYVEGDTLAKVRLSPRDAVVKLRDAAIAIDYAHNKGVIHRDVKPQNMMLDESGRVWVMDFGLARHVRGGTTLTVSGGIVGTPAYMPPEQARAKRCDARSDVYSLGATLYEMVTGQPPFKADNPYEILRLVVEEEVVAPRRLAPKLEHELETIVLKAMEKEPVKRYASAADLAADLKRHLDGEPILAKPASAVTKAVKWAKRHRALSSMASVLVIGVLALATSMTVSTVRFRGKTGDLLASASKAEEASSRCRRRTARSRRRGSSWPALRRGAESTGRPIAWP